MEHCSYTSTCVPGTSALTPYCRSALIDPLPIIAAMLLCDCNQTARKLSSSGVRVEVMERASIAKMIRTAEKAKTPVMAVVGDKEAESGSLSVRLYGGVDVGALPVDEVVARIQAANSSRGTF